MIQKTWIRLSALVLVVVLLGFGCRGLSEEEQASVTPVTLTYWTVFNDVATLQQFANEYSAHRGYVNINVRQVRFEEFEKLFVNALADDVAPDIVSLHARWLRQYQPRLASMPRGVRAFRVFTQGKYQPTTIVQPDNNLMPSLTAIRRNYISTVGTDVIIGQDAYGLPLAADTLALYYNVDLLDKAGIAVAPTTWEELTDAVKKATRYDANGNIVQSGIALGTGTNIDNAPDLLAVLMMQNGVKVSFGPRVAFADGLDRATESHPTLQAMRFYTDFARPTKDIYTWNAQMNNALEEFARGRSVFYIGFAHDKARIQARGPQLQYDIVPLPQLNSQTPSNVANYWVESVVKKSRNQDLAWDFIRFMSTPENIKRYTDATKQPSALRAHIAEQQGDTDIEPFASQILSAVNWYHGRDIAAAENAFDTVLTDYLQPYGENQVPIERDRNLLIRTSQIVQQTY